MIQIKGQFHKFGGLLHFGTFLCLYKTTSHWSGERCFLRPGTIRLAGGKKLKHKLSGGHCHNSSFDDPMYRLSRDLIDRTELQKECYYGDTDGKFVSYERPNKIRCGLSDTRLTAISLPGPPPMWAVGRKRQFLPTSIGFGPNGGMHYFVSDHTVYNNNRPKIFCHYEFSDTDRPIFKGYQNSLYAAFRHQVRRFHELEENSGLQHSAILELPNTYDHVTDFDYSNDMTSMAVAVTTINRNASNMCSEVRLYDMTKSSPALLYTFDVPARFVAFSPDNFTLSVMGSSTPQMYAYDTISIFDMEA